MTPQLIQTYRATIQKLSKEFETRVMTCWKFKWKMQQAMASSKHLPLNGEVHIYEFYIGEPEEDTHRIMHGERTIGSYSIGKN